MAKSVKVIATAFNLKGNKGSISFKWKSSTALDVINEKELIKKLENLIGAEISPFN